MKVAYLFVLVAFLCVVYTAPAPSRFQNFLLNNKWNNSILPLSYRVAPSYWDGIAQVPYYTEGRFEAVCGRVCTPTELDNYMFQTEQFLTMFGINLYDAATRELALALLGRPDVGVTYETEILLKGRTLQFGNIRGSAECKGIMWTGQCTDPQQTGNCGFCYAGWNGQNGVSLDAQHAFFFRMISDVYSYEGSVDQRCPEKNMPWTWNDWRPVAGENAWANLIGPLQTAYVQAFKNVNGISDASSAMQLAVAIFTSIKTQQMPNGGIAYSPWNVYDDANPALGGTASVENAASTLAGLKLFLYILQNNQNTVHKTLIPSVQDVITKLTNFIRASYDSSVGYFLQGGTYDKSWNFVWNRDPTSTFAVDCQTWVLAVIGGQQVDAWFGVGTALKVWQNTKVLGGYAYNAQTQTVQGVGFSKNQQDQVFSGEWSFGAVNMLRILAGQFPAERDKLLSEAATIRQAIDDSLTSYNVPMASDVVFYANKRYWIPFGWWANPIPSLCSASWAVFLDSNYNPFKIGGTYDV